MNKWSVLLNRPEDGGGLTRKFVVSDFCSALGTDSQIQILFEWEGNSYRAYLVLREPFDICKCEIQTDERGRETVNLNFNYLLDDKNVRYDISGGVQEALLGGSELTIILTGADGNELNYKIYRNNLSKQLRKLAPGAGVSTFLLAAGGLLAIGVGVYYLSGFLANGLPVAASPSPVVEIAPEPVSETLYRYSLNCQKIKFSLGEHGTSKAFNRGVVEAMQRDLERCVPRLDALVERCAAYSCPRKYPEVSAYSTAELNSLYQVGGRLEPGVEISLTIRVETPPVISSITAVSEQIPVKTSGKTQAKTISQLENEIMGALINQNASEPPQLERDDTKTVTGQNAPQTPAGPGNDSRRMAWQDTKPERGDWNTASEKTSPAAKARYWEEIDHGAAVRLGYSCDKSEKIWEIVFAQKHPVTVGTDWMIELTWPDDEITAYNVHAVDSQRLILEDTARAELLKRIQYHQDGLVYVHINHDNNYYWGLDELAAPGSLSEC